MHYTSINYIISLWYLRRTFTLKSLYSFVVLQTSRQKLLTLTVDTHLINISAGFDYHEWPVVLNSMILRVLRSIWMFCPFVNDHNNILLLVDQVTAVEHIVSIRKHSLKRKYVLFLYGSVNVNSFHSTICYSLCIFRWNCVNQRDRIILALCCNCVIQWLSIHASLSLSALSITYLVYEHWPFWSGFILHFRTMKEVSTRIS